MTPLPGGLVPTARGYAVLGVGVVALVSGYSFGGRALNAVVMPIAAVLLVGAVGLARVDRPEVERTVPRNGFAGETVRAELELGGGGRPVAVSVADALPAALDGDPEATTVADGDPSVVAYEVTLAERGVHTVGPATLTATDVFGLWRRSFAYEATDDVVAFPRAYPLHEGADILAGYVGLSDAREQFDGVREYERGDAVRDVNWKASAKRNEFVVTEYAGEGATNRVTVAVERLDERDDAVAEAAASLLVYLLEGGLAVGLRAPGVEIAPGTGRVHRRRALTALARLDVGGPPVETQGAEVVVRDAKDGARVVVDGTARPFGDLRAPSATSHLEVAT
jgi:uncharacterized protein (DUF58 family)